MQEKARIGLIGLAVMGANLARNLADKGISTLVYNRTPEKTRQFIKEFGGNRNLCGVESLEELIAGLERPRKIILMIKAGAPVDAMLDQLIPLLEKGDMIIDGGNSFFEDTRRRSNRMTALGFEFVGMGVSGGEEGALNGPSLMPGCTEQSYIQLEPILQAIAAKAEDGEPCVAHIGTDGAGHYVKMVHNGIEYADMQLIADVYSVMRCILGIEPEEMADVWDKWNQGELSSYLVEITSRILREKDEETGKFLVDVILDVAGQKGTGMWTSLSALELCVPTPTITEAVFARCMSTYKAEREQLSRTMGSIALSSGDVDKEALLKDLECALYAAKICAYAQGFSLLAAAGDKYGWKLDMGTIAKIWRNGCIIRAGFLDRVSDGYAKEPDLKNLLFNDYFAEVLYKSRPGWGRIIALAAEKGVAVPALSSALAYFDSYRTCACNANILQAQRDFFGAHTYQRVDKEGSFHTQW